MESFELDPRLEHEDRVEPIETTVPFQLGKNEEQVTFLSSQLSETEARDIKQVLREYSDLFAWTAANMPGIDPNFHCHRLSVCRDAKPVAQKKRKMGGERARAVKEETTKLLQAGFIREVKYSTWLANVVMVKKSNGKWRMCTDYTDLNKACPKDAYPLPHIDALVDGAAGHQRLSFLDAYSGLMDKIFRHQIGNCLEVYVDDMVIKSNSAANHLEDLHSIFDEVRRHSMRLNPAKCTFGVAGGKFLGFMLSKRGIEANPDKCQAIINMQSPRNVKEVQRLAGRIASLAHAETRYQHLEKTVLALVHTARRLQHYFQSHRVLVRTDSPITKVLRKPELAGRMVAWSVELSQFDIRFEPRGPIKAQSLADFLNEFTPQALPVSHLWTLHVDGSSNQQGSGAGIILEGPNKVVIEQSLRFDFKASNNQAEYEALLAGLRLAKDLGIPRVQCFEDIQIKHTPRELNMKADQLARLASSKKVSHLCSMIQQELPQPSIVQTECLQVQQETPNWMTGIIEYLVTGSLPINPLEAKKMRTIAARYTLIAGELYKRGFSSPLLKCLAPDQAQYVIREIHEGICGTHSGGRTLATKVVRAGYYWPTLVADCSKFVQQCNPCQQHGPLMHQPPEGLRIKHKMTSVEHPQTNGQAEAANKVILKELKRRLGQAKGTWPEHLPEILWAYRCTPQSSTKETPFRLTYGTDAMIPVEVGEPSLRRTLFNEQTNDEALSVESDLVQEARDQALINMEACRTRLLRKHQSKVKPRGFQPGDLVWRVTGEARRDKVQGKLAPNWDGPYRIMHNLQNGAYKLEELTGKAIPRTWNATHLKHYFS
uniref:Transposon Ty3-I Gag-Pol polyprotein n=1 Tax=Cajanus cajan TaxID=3821 RepID=A0A151R838_CAJCA|nr:Transposon Ty3-I Gag-Pol polyprotein [Cajanus cajan]